MDIKLLLITPVSGAVIGYFTNWLAIKMLFRPHEEKRLLGIKIPLTPGLIPKERLRLSAKMGEAIGNHLLTTDVLTESFASPAVQDSIRILLDKAFVTIKSDNRTIAQALEELKFSESVVSLEKLVVDNTCRLLKDEAIRENTAQFLTNKCVEFLQNYDLAGLQPFLRQKYTDLTGSPEFSGFIQGQAQKLYNGLLQNETPLSELLPRQSIVFIKSIIHDHLPQGGDFLQKLLEDYPALDKTLRETTYRIIDENIGRFVSAFINKEKVYQNIKDGLFQYLANSENQAGLVLKLWDSLDGLLTIPLRELVEKAPLHVKDGLVEKLLDFLTGNEQNSAFDTLWEAIYNAAASPEDGNALLYSLIKRVEPDFEQKLQEYIYKTVVFLGDGYANQIVTSGCSRIKNKLLSFKISALYDKLGESAVEAVKERLMSSAIFLLEKGASYVAGSMNVGALAEEQINKMDIAQGEQIILSVVNRELSAITWLGGVLGLMIGLITVALQVYA